MGTGDNRELSLSRRVPAFLRRLLPDDMPPPAPR